MKRNFKFEVEIDADHPQAAIAELPSRWAHLADVTQIVSCK